MVEHGIVKFFDERDGKKFGFLQPCDKNGNLTGEKDIFFHLNDGRCVVDDGERPTFGTNGAAFRREYYFPQQGDRVVFERTFAPKGDKALPWSFADPWNDTLFHLDLDEDYTEDDTYATGSLFSRFRLPWHRRSGA